MRYFLAFLDYPRLKFQTPSSQSYRGFYPKFLFTPTKHPVCLKDPVNLKPAQLKGLVLAHRKQKNMSGIMHRPWAKSWGRKKPKQDDHIHSPARSFGREISRANAYGMGWVAMKPWFLVHSQNRQPTSTSGSKHHGKK